MCSICERCTCCDSSITYFLVPCLWFYISWARTFNFDFILAGPEHFIKHGLYSTRSTIRTSENVHSTSHFTSTLLPPPFPTMLPPPGLCFQPLRHIGSQVLSPLCKQGTDIALPCTCMVDEEQECATTYQLGWIMHRKNYMLGLYFPMHHTLVVLKYLGGTLLPPWIICYNAISCYMVYWACWLD